MKDLQNLIRDRFLNVIFSIDNQLFLDSFTIDDSLGKDEYPGYVLKRQDGDTILTISIKKLNTNDLYEGSEGFVVCISHSEKGELVCDKAMWFYSSSLIGNRYICYSDNILFGNDVISILQRRMERLKCKVEHDKLNNVNDDKLKEYNKYKNMFDKFNTIIGPRGGGI